jgi:hypothetical protein
MPINVNVDPSNVPGWLLGLLLVVTFAAEVLDHIPTESGPALGLDPESCHALCDGEVGSWNPYHCACKGADDEEE